VVDGGEGIGQPVLVLPSVTDASRAARRVPGRWRLVPLHSMMGLAVGGFWRSVGIVTLVLAGSVGPTRLAAHLSSGQDAVSAEREPAIAYHLVEGARFFDILVARIGTREHILIGETDDMCLELVDQRDFDGDGAPDALVLQDVGCGGVGATDALFFVSGDQGFRRSNRFPGDRPTVERWNGGWSVVTGGTRYVLDDGRAVLATGH
jgi:hypothetical protein